jgi:hypothetical protein
VTQHVKVEEQEFGSAKERVAQVLSKLDDVADENEELDLDYYNTHRIGTIPKTTFTTGDGEEGTVKPKIDVLSKTNYDTDNSDKKPLFYGVEGIEEAQAELNRESFVGKKRKGGAAGPSGAQRLEDNLEARLVDLEGRVRAVRTRAGSREGRNVTPVYLGYDGQVDVLLQLGNSIRELTPHIQVEHVRNFDTLINQFEASFNDHLDFLNRRENLLPEVAVVTEANDTKIFEDIQRSIKVERDLVTEARGRLAALPVNPMDRASTSSGPGALPSTDDLKENFLDQKKRLEEVSERLAAHEERSRGDSAVIPVFLDYTKLTPYFNLEVVWESYHIRSN